MGEWRRVLLSKKFIVTAAVSLFLCCLFFAMEITGDKPVTLSGEELLEYIAGYPDFIDQVEENAENSALLSGLGSRSAYVVSNAEKTVEDYSALSGLQLLPADNTVIAAFSGFLLADAAVLAVVAAVILCFDEEKSKGLGALVHLAKNGRARLSLSRSFLIFAAALGSSLAASFFCMLTGILLRGNICFLAPLQSVPEFRYCSLRINLLQYLLISAFLRALGAALLGYVAQLFLECFGGAVSLGMAGFFGVLETALHVAVGGADRLAFLKIANVAALLRGDFFFQNYYNVNLFGKPTGFLAIAFASACICFVLLTAFCAAAKRYGNAEFAWTVFSGMRERLSRSAPNPPLFFWELKKILVNQQGALILAATVYLAANAVLAYGYLAEEIPLRDNLYRKYAGEVTEEKIAAMKADKASMEKDFDEKMEEYWYLRDNDGNPDRMVGLLQQVSVLSEKMTRLDEITTQAEGAYEVTLQRGIRTELVKPDTYELLLQKDKKMTDRISLFLLLGLVCVFSGISSRERQCHMVMLQRTLGKGRAGLLGRKVAALALLSVLLSVSSFLTQFLLIGETCGYNDTGAAVQSIALLRQVPFEISLGGYLVFVCIIRAAGAVAIACVVMLISSLCKNRAEALAVCAGVLVLPAMLELAGIWRAFGILGLLGYCY